MTAGVPGPVVGGLRQDRRLLPVGANLHTRAASQTGLAKTVLLGAASGIAGFCAGPILDAVLTLAAARGDTLAAGVLLAVYSAGRSFRCWPSPRSGSASAPADAGSCAAAPSPFWAGSCTPPL